MVLLRFSRSHGCPSPRLSTATPRWVIDHLKWLNIEFDVFETDKVPGNKIILGGHDLYRGTPLWEQRKPILECMAVDLRLHEAEEGSKHFILARSLTTPVRLRQMSRTPLLPYSALHDIAFHTVAAALAHHPSMEPFPAGLNPVLEIADNQYNKMAKRAPHVNGAIFCYTVIFQKDITEADKPEYGGHRECHFVLSQAQARKETPTEEAERPVASGRFDIFLRDPGTGRIIPWTTRPHHAEG